MPTNPHAEPSPPNARRPMLRMLHLADLHLGWAPRDWPTERARRRGRTRDTVLERAVDFALDQDVHLVVIAGDLFETYDPSDDVAHAAIAQLERLEAGGASVVTVPGNHDEITYPTSVYRLHADRWPGLLVSNPRPQRLGPVPTRGGDAWIYALAYVGGITPARTPLADFPPAEGEGVHIAAFHGTLGAGLGERSLPLDRDALGRAGYDYVALGHIHKPAEHRLGGTPAVYPGCVEGKGFDDPGVPNWTVVTFDAGRVEIARPEVSIQPIRTLDVDLTQIDTLDQLREIVHAERDPEAIVRVRLTGSLHLPELEPEALRAEVAPHVFHVEVRDETTAIAPDLVARWAQEPTVRGAFVQRMQAQLAEARDDGERERVSRALRYGVRALQGDSG